MAKGKKGEGSQHLKPVIKYTTLNLAKYTKKVCYKKKAKRAIQKIREFAMKEMHTKDVRIDANLNKFVWRKGCANPPRKIRIQLVRRRNEADNAKEKSFTVVKYVQVDSFKGLLHEIGEVANEA